MKISKLFHWLYASIMFLPLLVAPIFAIYSHRHTIDSYSVTRDKYQVVDFNQQWENGPSAYNINGIDFITSNDGSIKINGTSSGTAYFAYTTETIINHTYIVKDGNGNTNNNVYLYNDGNGVSTLINNGYGLATATRILYVRVNSGVTLNDYVIYPQLFDLTEMFGSGNEPTLEQFNTWFSNDFYEYTTSKKVLIQNGTETLNNTDIGSQFVYAIYNPLNDYFNFNNFLGIGNLYNWLQLNLFEGTAPLGFFIFWELLMYWLLISLIWLIFDVAMYVPKLAHRWLDKASLE